MIITITGKPGSGKSTVGQRLAETLGVPFYSVGNLRRAIAEERGLKLEAYNAVGETDPSTDREIDEYQRKLGQTETDFVIEGRLSFHFIPGSLKIYLDVDLTRAAERVFAAIQRGERKPETDTVASVADVRAMFERRIASDTRRYRQYYGVGNIHDPALFDLVLDTTGLSADEVFQQVLTFVRSKSA